MKVINVCFNSGETEEVELTSASVNRDSERVGPDCFELLTVLGKGAYGKVCACARACVRDPGSCNYYMSEHSPNITPFYFFSFLFFFRFSRSGKYREVRQEKYLP